MKILPPKTEPPSEPFGRRHEPRPSNQWRDYRNCLRWEFGFTCPFCLLHESDFVAHGVEGTGLTWVEHLTTRSADQSQANDYTNCVYSCRFCNSARKAKDRVDERERTLLDPTESSWGEHFEYEGERLQPVPADPDAQYTAEAYDVNDERKLKMRCSRMSLIKDRLATIREGPEREARLLEIAQRVDGDDRAMLIREAHRLRERIESAKVDLRRFVYEPEDRPSSCRCDIDVEFELPEALDEQAIEVAV